MVEDLFAALCALLDLLFLCQVLCGETENTEVRKILLSQPGPNRSHKSWVYTRSWDGQTLIVEVFCWCAREIITLCILCCDIDKHFGLKH